MQARFDSFLSQTHPGMNTALSPAEKEALFQQFRVWDSQQPPTH